MHQKWAILIWFFIWFFIWFPFGDPLILDIGASQGACHLQSIEIKLFLLIRMSVAELPKIQFLIGFLKNHVKNHVKNHIKNHIEMVKFWSIFDIFWILLEPLLTWFHFQQNFSDFWPPGLSGGRRPTVNHRISWIWVRNSFD